LRESKAEGKKTKQNKNIGGLHFQPIGIVSLTPGGNDDGFRGINQARLYTPEATAFNTPAHLSYRTLCWHLFYFIFTDFCCRLHPLILNSLLDSPVHFSL
jgi:hypothetical protein